MPMYTCQQITKTQHAASCDFQGSGRSVSILGKTGFKVSEPNRDFPKLGVPMLTIMENQMEKKMENEMETGFI